LYNFFLVALSTKKSYGIFAAVVQNRQSPYTAHSYRL